MKRMYIFLALFVWSNCDAGWRDLPGGQYFFRTSVSSSKNSATEKFESYVRRFEDDKVITYYRDIGPGVIFTCNQSKNKFRETYCYTIGGKPVEEEGYVALKEFETMEDLYSKQQKRDAQILAAYEQLEKKFLREKYAKKNRKNLG